MKEIAVKDYPILVFYSENDGGYIADIPDLEYCSAFGETPVEAVKQVLIAKKMWLESAEGDQVEVPKPNSKPEMVALYNSLTGIRTRNQPRPSS